MSEGKPCIKGLTINEVFDKNRITQPYIRKEKKLVKASWDDALNRIYEKTKNINNPNNELKETEKRVKSSANKNLVTSMTK